MKQHITTKQLNELSEKGKEKLRKWWQPKMGESAYNTEAKKRVVIDAYHESMVAAHGKAYWYVFLPLLSIGQMIEFLGDNKIKLFFVFSKQLGWKNNGTHTSSITLEKHGKEKLCDVLWEAVKEVLNDQ